MNQKVYNSDFYNSIKKILSELNVSSVLLVTGKKSFENSEAFNQVKKLEDKFTVCRVSDFDINPNFEDVERVVKELKKIDFEVIVSIGGGSVMDFAKLIKLYNTISLETNINDINLQVFENNLPHIAIPTTSGSGSEATHFAVLYKDKKKYSVAFPKLLPNYVILDSLLTETMPEYLTACSGMDALSQAIESLWAKNATSESKSYAKKGLELILPNILNAVLNSNSENRTKMLEGSHLAGKAINISKTTAPHALAYYLTKHHNIPHGEAVALNLDLFIEDNWQYLNKEDKSFILNTFECINIKGIISKIIELKKSIGLKSRLSQVKDLNIESYLSSINMERMGNNPKKYDFKELKERIIKYHKL